MALENLSIKHMSVKYDASRDILVYDRKLKDGAGTSMYGLEVCKSLHLPDTFLENAYALNDRERILFFLVQYSLNILFLPVQKRAYC